MSATKEFPLDHPLWADLSFTPDWVYQKMQVQRRKAQPERQPIYMASRPADVSASAASIALLHADLGPRAPAQATQEAPSRSAAPWTEADDLVLSYLNSSLHGPEVTLEDVARTICRTPLALKSRWNKEMRGRIAAMNVEEQMKAALRGKALLHQAFESQRQSGQQQLMAMRAQQPGLGSLTPDMLAMLANNPRYAMHIADQMRATQQRAAQPQATGPRLTPEAASAEPQGVTPAASAPQADSEARRVAIDVASRAPDLTAAPSPAALVPDGQPDMALLAKPTSASNGTPRPASGAKVPSKKRPASVVVVDRPGSTPKKTPAKKAKTAGHNELAAAQLLGAVPTDPRGPPSVANSDLMGSNESQLNPLLAKRTAPRAMDNDLSDVHPALIQGGSWPSVARQTMLAQRHAQQILLSRTLEPTGPAAPPALVPIGSLSPGGHDRLAFADDLLPSAPVPRMALSADSATPASPNNSDGPLSAPPPPASAIAENTETVSQTLARFFASAASAEESPLAPAEAQTANGGAQQVDASPTGVSHGLDGAVEQGIPREGNSPGGLVEEVARDARGGAAPCEDSDVARDRTARDGPQESLPAAPLAEAGVQPSLVAGVPSAAHHVEATEMALEGPALPTASPEAGELEAPHAAREALSPSGTGAGPKRAKEGSADVAQLQLPSFLGSVPAAPGADASVSVVHDLAKAAAALDTAGSPPLNPLSGFSLAADMQVNDVLLHYSSNAAQAEASPDQDSPMAGSRSSGAASPPLPTQQSPQPAPQDSLMEAASPESPRPASAGMEASGREAPSVGSQGPALDGVAAGPFGDGGTTAGTNSAVFGSQHRIEGSLGEIRPESEREDLAGIEADNPMPQEVAPVSEGHVADTQGSTEPRKQGSPEDGVASPRPDGPQELGLGEERSREGGGAEAGAAASDEPESALAGLIADYGSGDTPSPPLASPAQAAAQTFVEAAPTSSPPPPEAEGYERVQPAPTSSPSPHETAGRTHGEAAHTSSPSQPRATRGSSPCSPAPVALGNMRKSPVQASGSSPAKHVMVDTPATHPDVAAPPPPPPGSPPVAPSQTAAFFQAPEEPDMFVPGDGTTVVDGVAGDMPLMAASSTSPGPEEDVVLHQAPPSEVQLLAPAGSSPSQGNALTTLSLAEQPAADLTGGPASDDALGDESAHPLPPDAAEAATPLPLAGLQTQMSAREGGTAAAAAEAPAGPLEHSAAHPQDVHSEVTQMASMPAPLNQQASEAFSAPPLADTGGSGLPEDHVTAEEAADVRVVQGSNPSSPPRPPPPPPLPADINDVASVSSEGGVPPPSPPPSGPCLGDAGVLPTGLSADVGAELGHGAGFRDNPGFPLTDVQTEAVTGVDSLPSTLGIGGASDKERPGSPMSGLELLPVTESVRHGQSSPPPADVPEHGVDDEALPRGSSAEGQSGPLPPALQQESAASEEASGIPEFGPSEVQAEGEQAYGPCLSVAKDAVLTGSDGMGADLYREGAEIQEVKDAGCPGSDSEIVGLALLTPEHHEQAPEQVPQGLSGSEAGAEPAEPASAHAPEVHDIAPPLATDGFPVLESEAAHKTKIPDDDVGTASAPASLSKLDRDPGELVPPPARLDLALAAEPVAREDNHPPGTGVDAVPQVGVHLGEGAAIATPQPEAMGDPQSSGDGKKGGGELVEEAGQDSRNGTGPGIGSGAAVVGAEVPSGEASGPEAGAAASALRGDDMPPPPPPSPPPSPPPPPPLAPPPPPDC